MEGVVYSHRNFRIRRHSIDSAFSAPFDGIFQSALLRTKNESSIFSHNPATETKPFALGRLRGRRAVLGRHQQLGRVPSVRGRGGVPPLVVRPGRPPRKPLLSPHRPPRVAPAAPSRQLARERPLLCCSPLSYCRRAAPLGIRPHGHPQSGHGAPGGGPLPPRQAQPGEIGPPPPQRVGDVVS